MGIISTTLVLIILTILITISLYIKRKFSFWKYHGIPFVDPVFPYGSLKDVGIKYHTCEMLTRHYNSFKNKLPLIGLYFYWSPVALILDLDLIKCILVKDFNIFHERRFYSNEKDDPLSAHLFAIDGPKWKNLRNKFSSTFTSGKMKFMFPTVTQIGDRLVEKIDKVLQSECSLIEIKDYWARYTTDIIGSCAFGIECNTLNDQNALFREMGRKFIEKPKRSMARQLWLSESEKLGNLFGIKQLREDVSEFFLNIVKNTVLYRESHAEDRKDFMNLLIELKNNTQDEIGMGLTVEELAAQVFVFFIAGFETSSTLLTFCSYELAMNAEIQEKTRTEVINVLKKHNNQFTYEAMMEMKYLDQVLNESLRKYPPLTNLTRVASEDYQVPGTDYIIPKNTSVFIPVYSIHHDSDIYGPNPETFDPERFSADEISKRHPQSFLAFGDGQRNCIGLRFGMMQARVGLAKMLLNFNFSLNSKMKIPIKFSKSQNIIACEGGVWLNIERNLIK